MGDPPKKVLLFSETPIMAMNLNLLKQPRSLNPNPAHWKAECRAPEEFCFGSGVSNCTGFSGFNPHTPKPGILRVFNEESLGDSRWGLNTCLLPQRIVARPHTHLTKFRRKLVSHSALPVSVTF